MTDLDIYLTAHFLDAPRFAASCGITVDELDELIQMRLVPAPSYTVTEAGTVSSLVFGTMESKGTVPGRYFHPVQVVWIDRARSVCATHGPHAAYQELKERFVRNFQAALASLNATTWRLMDSFNDDGSPISVGLDARTDSAWKHFLHGTFGLCVASPISEAAIARKEVLQEKLIQLSGDGSRADFPPTQVSTVMDLIASYEASTMPFSPVEYRVSSRKRLVEDLRARIRSS